MLLEVRPLTLCSRLVESPHIRTVRFRDLRLWLRVQTGRETARENAMEDSRTHAPPAAALSRRRALRISAAAAALFLLEGCRTSRSTQELKEAERDLRRTLDELAQGEQEKARLSSIAERITDAVTELHEENEAFLSRFHNLSIDPDVSADDLVETVNAFEVRRKTLRDATLRAQDDLRAELTAGEWAEAVAVLNQKAAVITRPPWED
jgi:hypothetical protein